MKTGSASRPMLEPEGGISEARSPNVSDGDTAEGSWHSCLAISHGTLMPKDSLYQHAPAKQVMMEQIQFPVLTCRSLGAK